MHAKKSGKNAGRAIGKPARQPALFPAAADSSKQPFDIDQAMRVLAGVREPR